MPSTMAVQFSYQYCQLISILPTTDESMKDHNSFGYYYYWISLSASVVHRLVNDLPTLIYFSSDDEVYLCLQDRVSSWLNRIIVILKPNVTQDMLPASIINLSLIVQAYVLLFVLDTCKRAVYWNKELDEHKTQFSVFW